MANDLVFALAVLAPSVIVLLGLFLRGRGVGAGYLPYWLVAHGAIAGTVALFAWVPHGGTPEPSLVWFALAMLIHASFSLFLLGTLYYLNGRPAVGLRWVAPVILGTGAVCVGIDLLLLDRLALSVVVPVAGLLLAAGLILRHDRSMLHVIAAVLFVLRAGNWALFATVTVYGDAQLDPVATAAVVIFINLSAGIVLLLMAFCDTHARLAAADRQLRQQLMALDAANSTKRKFLAHMSHELKTPLNAVIGFSDILRSQATKDVPDKIRDRADAIFTSGVGLLAIVDQVFQLFSLDDQDLPRANAAVAPSRLVELAMPQSTPKAAGKKKAKDRGKAARIIGDIPPDLPPLWTDESLAGQALANILSNAVKYAPPESPVQIDARAVGEDRVAISVRDRGPGIAPCILAAVGDPVPAIGDPTIASERGFGLGLALTQAIMTRLDGKLVIESGANAGTTVTLVFPTRPGS